MSTSTEIVLSAAGIRKSFGKRIVLGGIDLEIARGQLVGIVGENGSGKTTLLRILTGLLSRDSGRLRINGSFGYCPQHPALFGRLTVVENFRYFAAGYGMVSGESWRECANYWMKKLNFSESSNQFVQNLSGGTSQKLNLSIALMHDPDLLILDEPYAGFDWDTYLGFWEISTELLSRNQSILVVSHLVHDRSRFDRLLEIRTGRLVCH